MTTTDTSDHTLRPLLKFSALLVFSTLLLSGCMPQADTTVGGAEEYQFKGKVDPLMSEPAANRAARLSERFKLIQARQ